MTLYINNILYIKRTVPQHQVIKHFVEAQPLFSIISKLLNEALPNKITLII